MTELTFGEWLRRQQKRDNPVGDLARDFIVDGGTGGLNAFSSVCRHILSCNPCQGAEDALNRANNEYKINT